MGEPSTPVLNPFYVAPIREGQLAYRIRRSIKQLHCCLAIPAAPAALSGVDPLHLEQLPPTLADVVSRCSSWLV
jgi:hypothetical protein